MNRVDIDGDRIFVVHDFMSSGECQALVSRAEGIGFEDAPISTGGGFEIRRDIRNNTRVMLDDAGLAASLWQRLGPLMPEEFGGRVAKELNERFRFYRYTPGQQFRPHVDGYFERENGDKSRFTFMVYLNDDYDGGSTRFQEPFQYTVRPKSGMALVFYHHQLHEGCRVQRGTKLVLRTDVMYAAKTRTQVS